MVFMISVIGILKDLKTLKGHERSWKKIQRGPSTQDMPYIECNPIQYCSLIFLSIFKKHYKIYFKK